MIATRRRTLVGAAAVCICTATTFVVLGHAVSSSPPAGIDAAARAVAGEAPSVAWIFTASCLWPALTVFGLVGITVARLVTAWRARIAFSIVTTLVSWQVSDALKDVFRRPRPTYWIVHHETSFAYSSGHAMFAMLIYWLWAYFIARSAVPARLRLPLVIVLVGWGCGVIWSRLALGAHYPSDLLGGLLLAATSLSLATIVATLIAPRARIA